MNIFKVEYNWYEDDHGEALLGKNVEREEFEKDIIKSKEFAESLIGKEIKEGEYLGKGYRVPCLPEFYEQIIWFLTEQLGYTVCYFDEDTHYTIEDSPDDKIAINRSERKIEWSELK